MANLDTIAGIALATAIQRGKVTHNTTGTDQIAAIWDELAELMNATEQPSEHIPEYTERQEEAADVIIATLTYLAMEEVNISRLIMDKMVFNLQRDVLDKRKQRRSRQGDSKP